MCAYSPPPPLALRARSRSRRTPGTPAARTRPDADRHVPRVPGCRGPGCRRPPPGRPVHRSRPRVARRPPAPPRPRRRGGHRRRPHRLGAHGPGVGQHRRGRCRVVLRGPPPSARTRPAPAAAGTGGRPGRRAAGRRRERRSRRRHHGPPHRPRMQPSGGSTVAPGHHGPGPAPSEILTVPDDRIPDLRADLIARHLRSGDVRVAEAARLADRDLAGRRAALNLARLRGAAGRAAVHYVVCDITAPGAAAAAARRVRSHHDRVDLFVHAATRSRTAPLERKNPNDFRLVRDVKINGYHLLREAFASLAPRLWCNIASVAAVHPLRGEIDYGPANAYLAAAADLSGAAREITLGFPLWRESGYFAAQPALAARIAAHGRLTGITDAEGVAHFLAELAPGHDGPGAGVYLGMRERALLQAELPGLLASAERQAAELGPGREAKGTRPHRPGQRSPGTATRHSSPARPAPGPTAAPGGTSTWTAPITATSRTTWCAAVGRFQGLSSWPPRWRRLSPSTPAALPSGSSTPPSRRSCAPRKAAPGARTPCGPAPSRAPDPPPSASVSTAGLRWPDTPRRNVAASAPVSSSARGRPPRTGLSRCRDRPVSCLPTRTTTRTHRYTSRDRSPTPGAGATRRAGRPLCGGPARPLWTNTPSGTPSRARPAAVRRAAGPHSPARGRRHSRGRGPRPHRTHRSLRPHSDRDLARTHPDGLTVHHRALDDTYEAADADGALVLRISGFRGSVLPGPRRTSPRRP